MSVALLIISIVVGVFGFIVAGPAGLILFAVFFGLFIWSMARDRVGASGTLSDEERDRPMQARRPGTSPRPGGRRHDDPPPEVPSPS